MEDAKFLRTVTLFSLFEPDELETLGKSFLSTRFNKDDVILEEGRPNRALHLVKNGRVRVTRRVQEREVALNDLTAGQTFGEMSIMDDGIASATLYAVSDTEISSVSMEELAAFLNTRPAAAAKFWREIAVELRRRLLQTNDIVRSYFEVNKALAENPTLRQMFAMCNR